MKFETLCLTNRKFLFPARWPMFAGVTGDEIVDGDDAMTFRQKPIRQMRAEKTRTSGDDRNRL